MKFKRSNILIICAGLILALLLAGCGNKETTNTSENPKLPEKSKEEVFELNVNSPVASTHHLGKNLFEPWKKYVEEKTNGRVKVNLYHGGALGNSTTSWQDINNRVYDVGLVFPTYYYDTELFPLTISNLSFAFSDLKAANNIIKKFNEKYGKDIFKNSKLIASVASDPYEIFSTKPIKTVGDIKGNKMRVQGKNETALVKGWGGSPVTVETAELYTAFDKNIIDIGIYTPVGAIGQKLYEVAPYTTSNAGVYTTPFMGVMNKEFFDSLPADLQKLFEEDINPKFEELFRDSYFKELEAARAEYKKQVEGKGEVIEISKEELKKFKAIAKDQWDSWVKDADNKGYDGEAIMKDFKSMIEDEGLELPF